MLSDDKDANEERNDAEIMSEDEKKIKDVDVNESYEDCDFSEREIVCLCPDCHDPVAMYYTG
jgi:hypothetical protein